MIDRKKQDELLKEPRGRYKKSILVSVLGLTLIGFMLGFFGVGNSEEYEETNPSGEWTFDQLQQKDEVDYALVDPSVLTYSEELKTWVDANKKKQGLYHIKNEEFSYIMISTGKSSEKKVVQLYDVRQDSKKLHVGYNFLPEPENTPASDNDDGIRFMLIRLEPTSLTVEGRVIVEQ